MSTSHPTHFVLAGLLCLSACGCHGYLLPYDDRPLPAQHPLETRGGQRLTVAGDGQLMSRPGRGDLAASLGVALYEGEAGLFVANALVAGSALQRGDRILWAVAALPQAGRRILDEHRAIVETTTANRRPSDFDNYQQLEPSSNTKEPGSSRSLPDKRPGPRGPVEPGPAPTASEFRQRAGAHAVHRGEDLVGYVSGAGWLSLDLLVQREGREVVLRVPLERRESWVPTRPRLPDRGRWRGLELVPLSTLPLGLRPPGSAFSDVLVTRVARGSPLGQAGLRPLDLISRVDCDMLLGSSGALALQLTESDRVHLEARSPDGRVKQISFRPRHEPTQLWFPFDFAYERGTDGYHFGLGWWDVVFHVSGRTEYSPALDDYVKTSRWSLLTVLSGGESRTEEGTVRHAGLNLILDPVRLDYFEEWFDTPDKVRGERGQEGY